MPDKIRQNFRAIDQTYALWRSKMRGDAPPYRSDLNQLDPVAHLLLELTEDERVTVRYAGHALENISGGMLAGRTLDSVFVDYHRTQVDEAVRKFFLIPQRSEIQFSIESQIYKMSLFPIRSDHGASDFALGATDLVCDFDAPRHKLAFVSSVSIPLNRNTQRQNRGFAEDKSEFTFAPKAGLRVISGANQSDRKPKTNLRLVQNIKREP